MANPRSGKGNKHTGKEVGLAEKPCWDSSYKIPKRPDTSVSSGTRTSHKADKHKHQKKKVDRKGSTPNKDSDPKVKAGGRSAVLRLLPQSDLPLDYWARYLPGDDTIPANSEHVEWGGGLVLFQGTRHFSLITFETELKARRQAGQQLRLWRAELIEHKC